MSSVTSNNTVSHSATQKTNSPAVVVVRSPQGPCPAGDVPPELGELRQVFDLRDFDTLAIVDVDWDGESEACDFRINEVVIGRTGTDDDNDLAKVSAGLLFRRWPDNVQTRFEAKLVPIEWSASIRAIDNYEETVLAGEFIARRGDNYDYVGVSSHEDVEYQASTAEQSGVHTLTFEAEAGYYEVWVRLQSPVDANQWLEQDPIIGVGNGSGN